MMSRLRPIQTIESVLDLDLRCLQSLGLRALIFDLDNTLCRRGAKKLDPGARRYLEDVQAAGFLVGILTNRRRNAKDPIVKDLREWLPLISSAGKPRRRGYVRLMEMMAVSSESTAMIGDKRWTDIWGANRLAIYSIKVQSHPSYATR